jgi:hypothetical protein
VDQKGEVEVEKGEVVVGTCDVEVVVNDGDEVVNDVMKQLMRFEIPSLERVLLIA